MRDEWVIIVSVLSLNWHSMTPDESDCTLSFKILPATKYEVVSVVSRTLVVERVIEHAENTSVAVSVITSSLREMCTALKLGSCGLLGMNRYSMFSALDSFSCSIENVMIDVLSQTLLYKSSSSNSSAAIFCVKVSFFLE